MIELPEALNLKKQLTETVIGKVVERVLPPVKPHRFCWFNGKAEDYDDALRGKTIDCAEGFGIFAQIGFEDGKRLCINDGVNVRLIKARDMPKNYQLGITFCDGDALLFTVAMYGGIILHSSDYANEYYLKSKNAVSPFSKEFDGYFYKTLQGCKPTLSAKAFLATEQRFPGIGNGVLQDILFEARIHPKRKIGTLNDDDLQQLPDHIKRVLSLMTEQGGRDTEKDLFGQTGGYMTKMSRNSLLTGCPDCGTAVVKEAYLGGSVYYCPKCQQLPADSL